MDSELDLDVDAHNLEPIDPSTIESLLQLPTEGTRTNSGGQGQDSTPTKQPAAKQSPTKREPISAPKGSNSDTDSKKKADVPATVTESDDSTNSESKKAAASLSNAENQKLLLISKKLGLPCKTASSSDDTEDPMAKRARRFGPVSEEAGKKQLRSERFGITAPADSKEKKQKRAERFGKVSSDSASEEKKKLRAQRFNNGKSASPVQDEKMQKRAERFGNAAAK